MLSIRSLCSLPTMVCIAADSVVDQVTLLPSNNSLRHSEQYLLYIRSLCSLPTLIVCTVVSQVALLSSYTGSLHCCKSGCSAPFLQQWGHSQLALLTACFNLFQFIPIYLNFPWIYLHFWVKREGMWKVELCVSAIIPTCDAAYILDRCRTEV